MRNRTIAIQSVVATIMALLSAVAMGAPFNDTFESFTPGVTVVGQGEWYAITGTTAPRALVQNAAGVAYAGDNYLDLNTIGGGVFSGRRGPIGTPLDSTSNVVSYAFRIGPRYGTARDEALYRFTWATGGGSNLARANVYENGTISYYSPGELNAGAVPLLKDEWYLFTYTYDLGSQVNLKVVRALDNSVNLDFNWTTESINQTTTYDLEWDNVNFAGVANGYHALLDNVAIGGAIPEPSSLLLLVSLTPFSGAMVRRRR